MIKLITEKDPNTGKEYVGEIIIDTIGKRHENKISHDFISAKADYTTIYTIEAHVNGIKVYSRSTPNREELPDLAVYAESSVITNIGIMMEEDKKGTIEEDLLKLGFKNNLVD